MLPPQLQPDFSVRGSVLGEEQKRKVVVSTRAFLANVTTSSRRSRNDTDDSTRVKHATFLPGAVKQAKTAGR